jgi:hypothetical protein
MRSSRVGLALRRRSTVRIPTTNKKSSTPKKPLSLMTKRFMSGGDHHDTPVPQSMKAVLWQGHSPEPEGWETDLAIAYTISFALIIVAIFFKPDTTIKSWAQTEARTRLALLESGKIDKVEFGRHYYQEMVQSGSRIDNWDKRMVKGISPGDDDDDEEEEETEEEDEEEE